METGSSCCDGKALPQCFFQGKLATGKSVFHSSQPSTSPPRRMVSEAFSFTCSPVQTHLLVTFQFCSSNLVLHVYLLVSSLGSLL
jgi:hypothetical protein